MTKNKESTKYLSDRQEIAIARALGGRKTLMSGAARFSGGDVVTKDFIIEAKTQMTKKKSFSVQKEWIDKVRAECFAIGKKNFMLAFNFGGEESICENYYVIDEETARWVVDNMF